MNGRCCWVSVIATTLMVSVMLLTSWSHLAAGQNSSDNGRFLHEESGTEIIFPEGWAVTEPIVQPQFFAQGYAYVNPASDNFADILVFILKKPEPGQNMSEQLPLDTAPVGPIGGDASYCENVSLGLHQVSGVDGWQGEWKCISKSTSDDYIVKSLLLQSPNYGLVFLYTANSTEAYNQYLPVADNSLNTLKMQNAQTVSESPSANGAIYAPTVPEPPSSLGVGCTYPGSYVGPSGSCDRNEVVSDKCTGVLAGYQDMGSYIDCDRVYADGASQHCREYYFWLFPRCDPVVPGSHAPKDNNEDTCNTQPPEPTVFKPYYNGLWRLNVGILEGEGLVIQDVNIGNSHLLDRLSMPHSKVSFSDGQEHIIRYCSSSDKHTDLEFIGDNIRWSFFRVFGVDTPDNKMDDGVLTISYHFIARSTAVKNCEPGKNECLRLIPTVTFKWNGDPSYLKKFTAYYKLDYSDGTGLTLIRDSDLVPGPIGKQHFQTKEAAFNAVHPGHRLGIGEFDNIHTGQAGDWVSIPGCRETAYDCLHMHWRWGKPRGVSIDPLIDPLTRTTFDEGFEGKPYLVPGQTIDIAVIKESSDPAETDPDDPFPLVNDGETIAVEKLCLDHPDAPSDPCLESAANPIVWYVSSVEDTQSTTFFKHGLFALDRSK
jgi:hypothetical protein